MWVSAPIKHPAWIKRTLMKQVVCACETPRISKACTSMPRLKTRVPVRRLIKRECVRAAQSKLNTARDINRLQIKRSVKIEGVLRTKQFVVFSWSRYAEKGKARLRFCIRCKTPSENIRRYRLLIDCRPSKRNNRHCACTFRPKLLFLTFFTSPPRTRWRRNENVLNTRKNRNAIVKPESPQLTGVSFLANLSLQREKTEVQAPYEFHDSARATPFAAILKFPVIDLTTQAPYEFHDSARATPFAAILKFPVIDLTTRRRKRPVE